MLPQKTSEKKSCFADRLINYHFSSFLCNT